MPATPSEVTRTDDASGDTFATFDNDAGRKVQGVAIDVEVQGELLAWANTGAAAENTNIAKGTPGRVFVAEVVLDPSVVVDRYLMVFNKASAPVNTDIPVFRALVPAGGQAGIDRGLLGRELTLGVSVAISTTAGVLTLPAVAEGFFTVGYL